MTRVPARAYLTAGKVGEASGITGIPEGSSVVVRNPGGAVVARPAVIEGDAYYVPIEPGRHRWEVTHPEYLPLGCVFWVRA